MEINMSSRKFQQNEIEYLQLAAGYFLKPISGQVKINEKPITMHWWSEGPSGRKVWDDFIYRITIMSSKGDLSYSETFNLHPDRTDIKRIKRIAWHIAHYAFSRFDGDIQSSLAESLWPKSNGYLPDYNQLAS